jgi:hypothetical protein
MAIRSRSLSAPALAALCSLTLIANAHAASSPTRAEYIATVEPFCHTAQEKIGSSYPRPKHHHHFPSSRAQGRWFIHSAQLLAHMTDEISTIPPPADDATLIGQWIQAQRDYEAQLVKSGRRLRAGKGGQILRLDDLGNHIDDIAGGAYGFRDCEDL